MLLAALMVLATPPGVQPPTLAVYLDLGKAPPALEQRVDERLRAALEDKGVPLVADPGQAPLGGSGDPLADAKRELDLGEKAYRELDLDTAIAALRAADDKAPAAATSPAIAGVVAEARVTLGLIALAQGKSGDADDHFRHAAVLEPDRRLDARNNPPEVVAAYESVRRAVLKAPMCELTLSTKPVSAKVTIDGRPATGTVRLPYGVHFVQASTDLGSAGERVELAQPRALVSLAVAPDASAMLLALRAAARRGDDDAAGAAADALAMAAGAERVVLWDLRQQGGRVEVPLRLREVSKNAFTWQVVADLGTAAAPDAALRKAVAELLDEAHSAEPKPTPRVKKPPGTKTLPAWVWWAAGGVALAAAGGAAAIAISDSKAEDDEVVIVVEK